MIKALKKKYALSDQGASDLFKESCILFLQISV